LNESDSAEVHCDSSDVLTNMASIRLALASIARPAAASCEIAAAARLSSFEAMVRKVKNRVTMRKLEMEFERRFSEIRLTRPFIESFFCRNEPVVRQSSTCDLDASNLQPALHHWQ